MRLAIRVELRPRPPQVRAFLQHAGCARWAWNGALGRKRESWATRKAAIEAGVPKEEAPKVPSAIDLHRELNPLKKLPAEQGGVPWMYESSKGAPQEALRDLDPAFAQFFRRVKAGEKPGHPRFESKRRGIGGFGRNAPCAVEHERIRLPRIGWVRLQPGERGRIPPGTYSACRVTEQAGRWFVSVLPKTEHPEEEPTGPEVGCDLGVRVLATLSDGTEIAPPRPLQAAQRRLKRAQRKLSRKMKGSNNRRKARHRVARLHKRISDIRKDALHKVTTSITKTSGRVVLEDLRVSNLTRRRRGKGRAAKAGLNRAILDCGLYEFRRQLEDKGQLYGCRIETVNPAYTSQTCSACGTRNSPGTSKHDHCDACGLDIDRDLNAAINILAAASCTEAKNACRAGIRRDDARVAPQSVTEAGIDTGASNGPLMLFQPPLIGSLPVRATAG